MKFLLATTLSVLLFTGLCAAQEDKKTTTTTTTTTTAPPTTTTTTTAAPTTTPAPSPTPKPTPIPKYPANEGKWSVENAQNSTCIMIKGALELVFKAVDNKTVSVDVPMTAVPTGNCSDATITLKWNASSGFESWIQFSFEKNETVPKSAAGDKLLMGEISAGKYALQNVTGVVFIETLNKSADLEILMAGAFQTPLNHSYSCLVQEELKNENVTLKMSDVRVEAFMERSPGHREFSAAIDCPADDSGDVVPIAVGAALAGLVVIVLIAYLIGRRRSRARGYQSV